MLNRIIDRTEAALEPYGRALSVLAVAWFVFGIAVNARFVRLPEWPWLSAQTVLWAGVVFNAVWWGFLRPAIARRRAARAGGKP